MRRLCLVAATVAAFVAATTAPAAAPAVVTGIGDQWTGFFDDARFQQLGVDRTRLIVPWDIATNGDEASEQWLQAAADRGLVPLVAFDHARGAGCNPGPCSHPSPEEYESAVRAFLDRYPAVTEIAPWNEPNHNSQPTFTDPGLAAAYYNAARRACPACTLVAGDLLDDDALPEWLAKYRSALDEEPGVWGLHDYYDATYYASRGVDTMLGAVPGELWLTETGGIVRLGDVLFDELSAAGSVRWLYALTAARPRVTRMYLYQWQSTAHDEFDAGLLRPDGSARPSLDEVRHALGIKDPVPDPAPLPPSDTYMQTASSHPATPAAGVAGLRLRGAWVALSGKGLRLGRRGLSAGLSCVAAPLRCDASLAMLVGPGRVGHLRFKIAPGRTQQRLLRLSRRTRGVLARARRVRVTLCLRQSGRRSCVVGVPRVTLTPR